MYPPMLSCCTKEIDEAQADRYYYDDQEGVIQIARS